MSLEFVMTCDQAISVEAKTGGDVVLKTGSEELNNGTESLVTGTVELKGGTALV